MTTTSTRSRYRSKRPLWISTFIAFILWVVAIVATGLVFIDTSQQAKSAAEGAVIDGRILGFHLFQGFKLHGLFGIHVQSGLLIMFLFVVVVSTAAIILGAVLYLRQIPKSNG